MNQPSPNLQLEQERRLIGRLLTYWHDLRGIRAMPLENDIDPEALGDDWGYCFLLQARDVANIQDYNFTYLGEKIIEAYGDRALDAHNQQMIGPNAFALSARFAQVLQSAAPLINEGEMANLQGQILSYRQILLPLGDEVHGVQAIFGGMSYNKLAKFSAA